MCCGRPRGACTEFQLLVGVLHVLRSATGALYWVPIARVLVRWAAIRFSKVTASVIVVFR